MKYIALLLLIGLSTIAAGQSPVKVQMLNGGTVKGHLLSMDATGTMVVQLDTAGTTITLPGYQIDTYTVGNSFDKPRSQWADRRWHHTTSMYVLASDFRLGVGADHTVHRQLRRGLDLGAGVAIANYRQNVITNMLAFYGSGRYYFMDQRFSPYVEARLGYGLVLPDDSLIESNGGAYLQTQVGFKLEQRSTVCHWYAGYQQQQAGYLTRSGERLSDVDIMYRRIVFGFSIGF